MDTPTTSSAKELGRIILLAIISYLLTDGVLKTGLVALGYHFTPEQYLIVNGLILSVLKAIDKYLHSLGKSIEYETLQQSNLTNGLTRF